MASGINQAKRKRKGERKDGLIQVSLQIGRKPDGKPDRRYFYGKTRAEAEQKRDAFKASLSRGISIEQSMTVEEWLNTFKATYREGVNKAYIANDNVPYNRLAAAIGKMRIADVREAHLQSALNQTAGMSSSTVTKYLSVIKRVFRKARKNRLVAEDPSEDLARPPSVKGSHRALERWEVDLILEHWHDYGVRAGLWVLLMLLCGLRRGEVIALHWESINLADKTLKVCETAVVIGNKTTIEQRAKTDAGLRILPICQMLYDALLTVPQEERHGLVCLSARGTLLTESAFLRGFESFTRAMERIANGEPPMQQGRRTDKETQSSESENRVRVSFLPHDLRHSFATALYDAGVPVKAAQYFLGHSDLKITLELYTHLSRERAAASNLQMVSYLDNWLEMKNLDAVKNAALEGEIEL